jgi:hypothetical protein
MPTFLANSPIITALRSARYSKAATRPPGNRLRKFDERIVWAKARTFGSISRKQAKSDAIA